MSEVARLRLPVAITPLAAIGRALEAAYGAKLTMRQVDGWLVIEREA